MLTYRTARNYYWEWCKRLGEVCLHDWAREIGGAIVVAIISYGLTHADKSSQEILFTAIKADLIYFAFVILYKIFRIPHILHSERVGAGMLNVNWKFGIAGIVLVVGALTIIGYTVVAHTFQAPNIVVKAPPPPEFKVENVIKPAPLPQDVQLEIDAYSLAEEIDYWWRGQRALYPADHPLSLAFDPDVLLFQNPPPEWELNAGADREGDWKNFLLGQFEHQHYQDRSIALVEQFKQRGIEVLQEPRLENVNGPLGIRQTIVSLRKAASDLRIKTAMQPTK